MKHHSFSPIKSLNKVYLLFLLLAFHLFVKAQNQLGITSSNYAGLYSLQINPANICYQPISLDINLFSANAFVNNNHYYSAAKSIFELPASTIKIGHRKLDESKITDDYFVIRKNIQSNGYVFGGVNILGPSLLLAISNQKSFAITTAFRTHLSATNLSGSTALALFEGPTYTNLRNSKLQMNNTKASFASWFEIGGSYAQVINKNSSYVHRLGGSVKVLLGLAGGYIYDNGYNGYNGSGNDLQMTNSSFNYAFADPQIRKGNAMELRGMGASIDFGYSIQRSEKHSRRRNICPNLFGYADVSSEYKWKAGFSLLDLGAIRFYNNSFATEINNGTADWKNWDASFKNNFSQIDNTLKANITGANIKSNNAFWLVMPAAISGQFDVKVNDGLYLNAIIIQRITPSASPTLARMNTLAVTPRFEKENIEVSVPFILNEYKNANIGFAIRYKYLVIGSDRVGETFGLTSVTGYDFYTSIRYSISERCKKIRHLF